MKYVGAYIEKAAGKVKRYAFLLAKMNNIDGDALRYYKTLTSS